jgi:hypothetical protein
MWADQQHHRVGAIEDAGPIPVLTWPKKSTVFCRLQASAHVQIIGARKAARIVEEGIDLFRKLGGQPDAEIRERT